MYEYVCTCTGVLPVPGPVKVTSTLTGPVLFITEKQQISVTVFSVCSLLPVSGNSFSWLCAAVWGSAWKLLDKSFDLCRVIIDSYLIRFSHLYLQINDSCVRPQVLPGRRLFTFIPFQHYEAYVDAPWVIEPEALTETTKHEEACSGSV